MDQVVEIEKIPEPEAPAAAEQKLLMGVDKWLGRSFVFIRWVVRGILIYAWASYLHHNVKRLTSSWAALSASLILFSLLLYACSSLYLRFAHLALASVTLNKFLALFNLVWSFLLLLIGSAFSLFAAEDNFILASLLSLLFYPHTVTANLFTHLAFARHSLSQVPSEATEPPPKRAPICACFLQILLLALWFLYPIARIHDSYYQKSSYIFTWFILSTLIATVSFITFFCSAIALIFLEHEMFPTLL